MRDQTITEIRNLPAEFTPWGTVRTKVLDAFLALSPGEPYNYSVETGTGRTTLLLSHLSKKHVVFSLTSFEQLGNVQESRLLDRSVVEFVAGPTQKTVPQYQFQQPIEFALLDGPHAYPFPEIEYFYIYPHLKTGALLVIDDLQIPTVNNLYKVLAKDEMYELVRTVDTTAFFRRTDAPCFDPYGDGWEHQGYNESHHPALTGLPFFRKIKSVIRENLPEFIQNKLRVVPDK